MKKYFVIKSDSTELQVLEFNLKVNAEHCARKIIDNEEGAGLPDYLVYLIEGIDYESEFRNREEG